MARWLHKPTKPLELLQFGEPDECSRPISLTGDF